MAVVSGKEYDATLKAVRKTLQDLRASNGVDISKTDTVVILAELAMIMATADNLTEIFAKVYNDFGIMAEPK